MIESAPHPLDTAPRSPTAILRSRALRRRAAEVNVYTSREPALIKPVLDAFTKATGIKVNAVFLHQRARGAREGRRPELTGGRDPAGRRSASSRARSTWASPSRSPIRDLDANVPATLRDPDGHWFATTLRSRVIYASKDRVTAGRDHL